MRLVPHYHNKILTYNVLRITTQTKNMSCRFYITWASERSIRIGQNITKQGKTEKHLHDKSLC